MNNFSTLFRCKLNDFAALMRCRSTISKSIHDFFHSEDFILVQTPIMTSSDCEGAGEVFSVTPPALDKLETASQDYFGKDVYLTVSGQLHLEAACNGLAKVYNFSPAFRAERGRTRRHLAEFTMIEAEMAFVHDMNGLLDLIKNLIVTVCRDVLSR